MDEAFRDGKFHLTIELSTAFRPGYQPGEEPRWGENRAPSCQGLPNPGGSQENPRHGTHFDDGTNAGSTARSALPALFTGVSGAGIPDPDAGLAGTTAEQQLVTALLHPDATTPSAITTLLAGPMLRGSVVDQR
jgi:phospholipid/cholesterol/gamma-HCH transport system substrate-binding protein